MGRILTERHSGLFEKRIKNPFRFLHDVYKTGKLREFSSFIVWEAMHRLGLFAKEHYVAFSATPALALDDQRMPSTELDQRLIDQCRSFGVTAVPSKQAWKVLFIHKDGTHYGSLANDTHTLYVSRDDGETVSILKKFPQRIKSLYISSQNTLFVCITGAVYRSRDNGRTFHQSLVLGSAVSFFRHNNAMTETPTNVLIIAEYGNIWDEKGWRKLAYLYLSDDEGETWQRSGFLIDWGTNKHVHLVKYSALLNKVVMADGDNYKKLWMCSSREMEGLLDPAKWKPVNRFHIQMGGYTAVVETENKLIFGTDYQGGTNFVVSTRDGRFFEKRMLPDPYRRSPIDNMVLRQTATGTEIWANLPFSTANSRCLLMLSKDGGQTWHKIVAYNRAHHKVWLISAAAGAASSLYFSLENVKSAEQVVYRVTD